MKVQVLKQFEDFKEGCVRCVGNIFECDEARFREINKTLPNTLKNLEEKVFTKKVKEKEE